MATGSQPGAGDSLETLAALENELERSIRQSCPPDEAASRELYLRLRDRIRAISEIEKAAAQRLKSLLTSCCPERGAESWHESCNRYAAERRPGPLGFRLSGLSSATELSINRAGLEVVAVISWAQPVWRR